MEQASKLIDLAYSTAIEAAIEASRAMMPYWPNALNPSFDEQQALGVITKEEGVGNFATKADLLSERVIIDAIQRVAAFKTHSISAEETGDAGNNEQWRWSIDPIDGTMNFLHGLPDFGVCIALFDGERVVVGVIAIPALGQLIAVKDGQAAKLLSYDGVELADLAQFARRHGTQLDQAIVGYNLGYAARDEQLTEIANKLITRVGQGSSLGSFALGNFRVAQGAMGAYFGMAPTVMDVAPADAILRSVGGVVTDMSGNAIDWTAPHRTYLGCANARIHEQLVSLLLSRPSESSP